MSLRAGLLALALAACAPLPQRAGIPTEWRPSPNFNERRPNFVVLHHTSNAAAERALATLTDAAREVSAHYLVARDGRIYQLVDEHARAWHAGASYWGGATDLNSASIGVELDNDGVQPYPQVQIDALLRLLADLRARLAIPAANVIGHADVAPGRKSDPDRNFPWRLLAEKGFGLWCEAQSGPPPAQFDDATALAALGYSVSDLEAAVAAFKRHYVPEDAEPGLRDADRARLACLLALKRVAGW